VRGDAKRDEHRSGPARAPRTERGQRRAEGTDAAVERAAEPAPDLVRRVRELETEIARLRAAHASLEASRANLADRYDFAPVAFLTVDVRCRIVDANLTAATMFGRERGKLVGSFLTGIVVADQRATLRAHVERCLTARTLVESELVFAVRGASLFAQISSTPLFDQWGEPVATRTVITDISALRSTHERLRFVTGASGWLVSSFDTKASLMEIARTAVPAMADVCLVDLVGEGDSLERFECVLGAEAQAASVVRLYTEGPRAYVGSALEQVLRTRQPLLVGADAAKAPVAGAPGDLPDPLVSRLQATSILYIPIVARGEVFGVLTFVYASSGRRYTEVDVAMLGDLGARAGMAFQNARLYAAAQRAIAARQDVLSFVSHDLKNPLMGVMLSVETMLRAAPPVDRRRSASQLQRVARAAQQMRRMIDDLLDVSTLEGGRLTVDIGTHDLASLLDEVIELFNARATELGIQLDLSRPATLPVACDRQRLQQVVSNLVDNALKFTPRGGRITVTARVADGNALCIVADSGAGIPPLLRPHVFERFVQADGMHSGRGLGLYIAKGLIEAQRGAIWVDSQEGAGTTFSFTVPLARGAEVEKSNVETAGGSLGPSPIVGPE